MLRRVPSEDLDLLVTAINIQHEVGGNLAQILTTIGHTIRERVRINGEIKVLTAQVQISGIHHLLDADFPGGSDLHDESRLHHGAIRVAVDLHANRGPDPGVLWILGYAKDRVNRV